MPVNRTLGGQTCVARNSWLQAPPILVPKLAPFRTFGNCIERTNTHNTETHDTGQPTTARTDGPTKKHAKSPTELNERKAKMPKKPIMDPRPTENQDRFNLNDKKQTRKPN